MRSARARSTLEVGRALARALSAHRLYPDDPSQPGFRTAVEQLREAAGPAVAGGPVSIEILRGIVHIEDEPHPDDEVLAVLARACFERSVEHVAVSAVPDIAATVAFAEALSTSGPDAPRPDEFLTARGVFSIALHEHAPRRETTDHADGLTEEQRALWERLRDPEAFATSLQIQGLPDDPGTAAERLFQRFAIVHRALPVELAARGGLYGRMRRVMDALPAPVGREFLARVVSRLVSDDFANVYLVDMTDTELAAGLQDLAADGGPDPRDVARRVVDATGRPGGLVDLVTPPAQGGADDDVLASLRPLLVEPPAGRGGRVAGTGVGGAGGAAARGAGAGAAGGDRVGAGTSDVAAPEDGPSTAGVQSAVLDALTRRLADDAHADADRVRSEWPADPAAERAVAELALADYLASETDLDALEAVLERWSEAIRDSLRANDVARVTEMLDLVRGAAARNPVRRLAPAFREAARSVLTPAVLDEVVPVGQDEQRAAEVRALLQPFGADALDAVLDHLQDEERRDARAQLVSIAAYLALGRVARLVQRLDDPRWYVVRNLVTILGRIADPSTLPAVVRMTSHPHVTVRREALRALVAFGGEEAMVSIRRLADDPDEGVRTAAVTAMAAIVTPAAAQALADVARRSTRAELQSRAITALADHPADEAVGLLERLADRRSSDPLPRHLRKLARSGARARRSR